MLFDAGFGRNAEAHLRTMPWLMRQTTRMEKERTVAEQLAAAGISPQSVKGVILTHAHWDHVSGLEDLRGVPVWVNKEELEFIRSGDVLTALARQIGTQDYRVYEFGGGPYLGFAKMPNLIIVPAHDRRIWERLPSLTP